MLFTFVTITYNHERFIIQHLESIKYQIITYGKENKYQLVVSDDCSIDNTISLVNIWIKNNGYLFSDIKILINKRNIGTCKNYTKAIKSINGDYFKALAGDDVFAKDNIFEAVKLLKNYDIVITIIAPFNEDGLDKNKQIYSRIYTMYSFTSTDYLKLSKNLVPIPMTPGIFIRKELYTESVLEFINQFVLVEDLSAAIKIYEDNKYLKIGYYNKVTALYRHHSNAITKTKNSKIESNYSNDRNELDKHIIKTSDNVFLKFRTRYNLARRKIKNDKLAHLLNMDVLFYRIGFILNYPRYRKKMNIIISDSFLPNEAHLKYIVSEAKKYDSFTNT